jgi:5'-nucleotidase
MALGSVGLSAIPSFAMKKNGLEKLLILHTNDIHSRVEPFSNTDPKYAGKGGLSRIAAYVKKLRETEPELLLFDSGDFSQGTPYFNFFKDEVILRLMSEMGYNATTVGNHEFDNGVGELAKGLRFANFSVVSSNYNFSETPLAGMIRKNLILERKGIRVGIYGLGIELSGLVDKTKSENTIYLDPVETALDQEHHLKKHEKCDLVICLSHLGYEYASEKISDIKLAGKTRYTDLILGGHTHTLLDKPVEIQNAENRSVTVNQAGWAALMVGQLEFHLERQKRSIFNFSENKRVG